MLAPDGQPRIDRQRLLDKSTGLDRTIRQLGAMRDGLRHVAACRAPSHMECPVFRRFLEAASAAVLKGATGSTRSQRQRKSPRK